MVADMFSPLLIAIQGIVGWKTYMKKEKLDLHLESLLLSLRTKQIKE